MRKSSCHKAIIKKGSSFRHISRNNFLSNHNNNNKKAEITPTPTLSKLFSLLAFLQQGLKEDIKNAPIEFHVFRFFFHIQKPKQTKVKKHPLTSRQKLKKVNNCLQRTLFFIFFNLATMLLFNHHMTYSNPLPLLLFPLLPEPTISIATPHMEVPLSGSLPYPKLGPGPVGWYGMEDIVLMGLRKKPPLGALCLKGPTPPVR